jgi:hypothetical protein
MDRTFAIRIRGLMIAAACTWVAALLVVHQVAAEPGSATGAALSGIDQSGADSAAAIAMKDPWVQARTGTRTGVVEVTDPHDGKTGVIVRFIDYVEMEHLTVVVDPTKAVIVNRFQGGPWPNYSPAEEADASEIALADPEVLARQPSDGFVVNNLTGATDRGVCEGRRCMAVFLTPPDGDYAGLLVAIVDLGSRRVVAFEKSN